MTSIAMGIGAISGMFIGVLLAFALMLTSSDNAPADWIPLVERIFLGLAGLITTSATAAILVRQNVQHKSNISKLETINDAVNGKLQAREDEVLALRYQLAEARQQLRDARKDEL